MSFSREITEAITQKYIAPFLVTVRQHGLSDLDAVATAVWLFERYGNNFLLDGALATILKDNPQLKDNGLLCSAECHPALLALGKIYLDYDLVKQLLESQQSQKLSDSKKAESGSIPGIENIVDLPGTAMLMQLEKAMPKFKVQTAIRRILCESVNAVPCLSKQEVLPLLPKDSGGEANILYGMTYQIRYQLRKKLPIFSCFHVDEVREEFSEKEIMDTLTGIGGMWLFSSLYEALEFATYQNLFEGVLCPVWAVAYKGNPNEISYDYPMGQTIGGRPFVSSESARLKPEAVKESVIPLRGILMFARNRFADYRVIKTVDAQQFKLENDEEDKPQSKFSKQ